MSTKVLSMLPYARSWRCSCHFHPFRSPLVSSNELMVHAGTNWTLHDLSNCIGHCTPSTCTTLLTLAKNRLESPYFRGGAWLEWLSGRLLDYILFIYQHVYKHQRSSEMFQIRSVFVMSPVYLILPAVPLYSYSVFMLPNPKRQQA
jgi:hypothetical protein